jgi:hypothetical protein
MKNVFVETNWVVAFAAPSHQRVPDAVRLAERAQQGELRLYLPSICLAEARHPIRSKYQPRTTADSLRRYLAWATRAEDWDRNEHEIVRRALDRYESRVLAELEQLDNALQQMRSQPGIEVFALDEMMLERSIELTTQELDLKPYDQSILAAVIVRSEQLRARGEVDFYFCELDGDLQPWDKKGQLKQPLTRLYDEAHVWVYKDFTMMSPERRANWPS